MCSHRFYMIKNRIWWIFQTFLAKQIFCYIFLSFYESQSLQILYTHWEWPSILWDRKQNWDLFCLLFPFFHLSLQCYTKWKFVTNISQELLHIGFCNLVQVLWIFCCFMGKRTRFLLLILPLSSSFFFLSNFQLSKNFISLCSGTERHRHLKLDTHMGKGLIYCVHQKQTARIYLFLHLLCYILLSLYLMHTPI